MADLRLDRHGVVVACPACGRANRMAYGTLDRTTRCGACKTPLEPPASPVPVPDTESFDAAAAGSALPVLVDFWAPWCAPCRMVAPELEKVARQARGRVLVVKVNTDELTDVAARYRIQSIPTLAVVHRGQEIDRASGARPAQDILALVERAAESRGRRAS